MKVKFVAATAASLLLASTALAQTGADTMGHLWTDSIADSFFQNDGGTITLRSEEDIRSAWENMSDIDRAMVSADCAAMQTGGAAGDMDAGADMDTASDATTTTSDTVGAPADAAPEAGGGGMDAAPGSAGGAASGADATADTGAGSAGDGMDAAPDSAATGGEAAAGNDTALGGDAAAGADGGDAMAGADAGASTETPLDSGATMQAIRAGDVDQATWDDLCTLAESL